MSKTVVLGVSGGIAAYKACDVVSRLRKENVQVNVIMTKHATEFVSALTFQSISQNPVAVEMFEPVTNWDIEHISLAKKADIFLIAPATANVIGKIANGIADDMLSTTVMATKAPVVIAPAMNTNMYENPVTQANIQKLKDLGYIFIEPGYGRLACGDLGPGKLAEPDLIVENIKFLLNKTDELKGKNVLVTAGPTQEAIDPVRYITNKSTGKMGYALAYQAALMGAKVTLVTGPTNLEIPFGISEVIKVKSAQQMYEAVTSSFDEMDIVIKSAAVADYKPKNISDSKIKKSDSDLVLELDRNKDILFELGKLKTKQVLVGFAAETDDLIANAQKKLAKKNLDFIVANDLKQEGAGFAGDTNIVKLLFADGNIQELPIMTKNQLSKEIYDKIIYIMHNK
ncbi:fused 4'-phosphopantothenoylcysteine decarboxylase; phosphopantothenoylcysteine synthetase, FMN-binding [Acetoanaerobium sticklandii]|uniref:Coenzyme A biosynthesis bifunctional protein CoaBC n=1 Tax=Acetoanaerobium sticklandii (strain ATCC 12662 / DSM 519 / JCM 1433 / CCUG 9281 / NCIMB 10654 / HF) TaxID=499177 RepID=E3PSX4_ACESD|nr:bifunctional phosphopantothenoylcysteine decarboxylase/phosphopantothenate--cysteine ligase CoaBC [Acetoanaerobium sticklandii]CBH21978.1 fused 4'-phosphopantothenoylcysteine decarboxylase; phosphopantothenoylcysteine synthetase, FMN-binding [Acetoanaerobium sticklandii]